MNDIIKKLFGLEQKELALLLFFLVIFIFLIYSLALIFIERIFLSKQLKKYKITEKYKQEILLMLILPILFLILVCFGLIEVESWLGFLGGYFGVLGAIFAINWENEYKKIQTEENLTFYIEYICQNLIPIVEEKSTYIVEHYLPIQNYDYEELTLEGFNEEDFDIIRTEIINNNLFSIISNKNFKYILDIKKNIEEIQWYTKYLSQNFISKDEINKINWNNVIECYISLEKILETFNTNTQFYFLDKEITLLNHKDESIIKEYNDLINNINIRLSKPTINSIDILVCYSYWLDKMNELLSWLLIKKDINLKVYNYFKNCSNLVNSLINLHNNLITMSQNKEEKG